MRLQQLEISGFKSFPERANLAFDDGVTAIVGPNGCGKSNVIDAITWVLGEQSAKSLRGERMEDVIFAGSDGRKPISTAEVTLFLEQVNATPGSVGSPDPLLSGNTGLSSASVVDVLPATSLSDDVDLDPLLPLITRDVEVGRRLYRSGESEYLIDGRVCRLRDIQDLLMDSGVGVKAYAVIEQGKIGQILGARPTERRQLLEEAAGVTKYKSRRRAAELKLEAARQNLTRVDDIVFEVEKQRRALKRQAAKARRYRRLREELRRWETVGFARRHQTLADAIAFVHTRLEAARGQEQAAVSRVAVVEGNRERCQIELAEAETGATRTRDTAHAFELAVERRQQQITFDTQQIDTLGRSLTEMGEELEELQAKRDPARVELETHVADAARCGAERDEFGASLGSREEALVQAHHALDGLEGDVEAARSEVFAAINAATALRHAVEHASDGQTRLGESRAKLAAEDSDVAVETAQLKVDLERLETEEGATRAALEHVTVVVTERECELRATRGERETLARDLRDREQQLASSTGRLTSLRDLESTRADYSDAARLLLSDSTSGVHHLGSVADHFDVEIGRERAVEACLGDFLEYVVVASRADAVAGLDFVREHGAGRVGFLVVEGHPAPATPSAPHADVESLASVVKVTGSGAAAVSAAITDHWLAPSFEVAARAAVGTKAPIATPDGDVFRGPARIEGGAKGEALGLLETKRATRELEARIADEEAEVRRLTIDIARQDEVMVATETALTELGHQRHQHEKTLLGHDLQRLSLAETETRLSKKREVIHTERRTVEEELAELEARRTEAQESIERLEGEQGIADERFMAAQRRVLDARESIDTLSREVAEVKAGHAALVERASALEASANRLERASQELEDRVARRTAEHARTRTGRESLAVSVASSKEQLNHDLTALDASRDDVRTTDEQVLRLREQLDTEDMAVRAARADLEQERGDVAELDLARATSERDFGHLEESCQETLQLTLSDVVVEAKQLEADGLLSEHTTGAADNQEERDELADSAPEASVSEDERRDAPDELEAVADETSDEAESARSVDEMVMSLREKIDRLGPVNMMAIEEFDDLDERYDFLTGQRQDLVESISATGDAISRINKTTRERFREAFDAINSHFQETFSTLFGGGRAGLTLLDETDLLESGIDIIAQPPGKRLQSVQLLSGGEKALSAMALMFAIFKYKPSPFCLLDEIDAPLDEANIGRFVEMLRGMQSETQFILVTHNRKTMEIADRLYGVTMEEPGVSKLISVQLRQ